MRGKALLLLLGGDSSSRCTACPPTRSSIVLVRRRTPRGAHDCVSEAASETAGPGKGREHKHSERSTLCSEKVKCSPTRNAKAISETNAVSTGLSCLGVANLRLVVISWSPWLLCLGRLGWKFGFGSNCVLAFLFTRHGWNFSESCFNSQFAVPC